MNSNFSAFEIKLNIAAINNLSERTILDILKREFGEILLSQKITKYHPSYKQSKGRNALRKILLKRDGDLCCWCKKPVLFDVSDDDPQSCSIEHLKRKSDGGTNSLDNLALAHKVCNNERHK